MTTYLGAQIKEAPRGGNLSGARTNNHDRSIANMTEEVKMNTELNFIYQLNDMMASLPDSGDIDILSIMFDYTNKERPVANVWLYHCIDKVEKSLGRKAQLHVQEGTDRKYLYKTLSYCNGSVVLDELLGELEYVRH